MLQHRLTKNVFIFTRVLMFLNKLFSYSAFLYKILKSYSGFFPLLFPSYVIYSEFIQNAILVFLSQSVFVCLGAKGIKTPDCHNNQKDENSLRFHSVLYKIDQKKKKTYATPNSLMSTSPGLVTLHAVCCFLPSACKCRGGPFLQI